MKKLFYVIIFLSLYSNSYCQLYDLIITSKNDSIVCRIDSVSGSSIYFNMKIRNNWVNTNIDRNEVIAYKYGMIDKKDVAFKSGSSFIMSGVQNEKKHAIHCYAGTLVFWGFLSFNYEAPIRIKPGKSKLKFTTGFVYRYDDNFYGVPLNLTALYGKTNKYFELTAGVAPIIKEEWHEGSTYSEGYTDNKFSAYPIIEIGFRHELKGSNFYRIILGSTGLGIGAGFAF